MFIGWGNGSRNVTSIMSVSCIELDVYRDKWLIWWIVRQGGSLLVKWV